MSPENLKFGGGSADTILHPVIAVVLLLAVVLLFCLPRRLLAAPVLLGGLLVPYGQQVVVSGIHFPALRMLILAGCVRMIFLRRRGLAGVDVVFVSWAVLRAMSFVLLFANSQALINQCAFLLDTIGGFLLLRALIVGPSDIRRAVVVLGIAAAIVACCMVVEHVGHVNVFGLLGSVPVVPQARGGALRAQGPFAHPILAGTFGATLLPLFIWLWVSRQARTSAVIGILSSTIITLTSASSTPVLAYAAGVLAVFAWPLRRRLGTLRAWALAMFALLALVMKAPVWFLIARVDVVGGSSGYHRAMLVDQFIRHFSDWWLIGTDANGDWGWSLWDTCNQFVTEGQYGGLAGLVAFISLLWICFRRIGIARRAFSGDRRAEWLFFLLGAALFSHVVAFFGIAYFDQTRLAWFAILAIIIAATSAFGPRAAQCGRLGGVQWPAAQAVDSGVDSRAVPLEK